MRRAPPPKKVVDALKAYREEGRAPLNLSNNTSVFDANPAVQEALATLPVDRLHDYPSLDSRRLREAAATRFGLRPEMVVTGNGSNDLIDLAIRAYCEPGDRVAWHPPSFEMIPVFARANGAEVWDAPLGQPGFTLDVERMLQGKPKVAVVCRPNNPTGEAFPFDDVRRLVRESPGLVVVDEAYGEFLPDEGFAGLVREHPNLLVLRTLSKAHGLAGLRVGYGMAQPAVVEALYKVRGPFRLNTLSEHVAVHALQRDDHVRRVVAEVADERERLAMELRTRGFTVQPSDANFVMFKPPVDAQALQAAMLGRGIAIRAFSAPGLRGWVRATVGPAWVTQRFLRELDDALREVGPR